MLRGILLLGLVFVLTACGAATPPQVHVVRGSADSTSADPVFTNNVFANEVLTTVYFGSREVVFEGVIPEDIPIGVLADYFYVWESSQYRGSMKAQCRSCLRLDSVRVVPMHTHGIVIPTLPESFGNPPKVTTGSATVTNQ